MKRFVEGADRGQSTLFPECLDDWIDEDNPVRVIDVFVDELDLGALDFGGVDPKATGRPSYHPSILLKLYVYGYLNRVQSSRRLEREAGRNVEVMWLTGRLVPDHKTIADFRKDNGRAIRQVCSRFIVLCRTMGLFAEAGIAIDGSKFKAVNNRDKNFTRAKMQRRMTQIEESVALFAPTRQRRPAGAFAGAHDEVHSPQREDRKAERGNGATEGTRCADAGHTGPADIADRSRCPFDGHKRSRLRRCRLQRAGRRRHQASSDRHAPGDQCRQRPVATGQRGKADQRHTGEGEPRCRRDRGYFNSTEILACEEAGITVTLPKPMTSNAKADG